MLTIIHLKNGNTIRTETSKKEIAIQGHSSDYMAVTDTDGNMWSIHFDDVAAYDIAGEGVVTHAHNNLSPTGFSPHFTYNEKWSDENWDRWNTPQG